MLIRSGRVDTAEHSISSWQNSVNQSLINNPPTLPGFDISWVNGLSQPEKTFIPAVFTQVSLPRSMVAGREYRRVNGDAWLIIQAGSLDFCERSPKDFPIPYGVLPRLILCDIAAYAKQKKTKEIYLEDSASKYLKRLGLDSQGVRYETLHKQICALAACRLQYGYQGKTYNGLPIAKFEISSNFSKSRRKRTWPKTLTLSEDFFQSIVDKAVPLDRDALISLKGSALALDIYVWSVHRLFRLRRPTKLWWKTLRQQFSPDYSGTDADKNFKKSFIPALKKVLHVYPQANIKIIKGGIKLEHSPPPVATSIER